MTLYIHLFGQPRLLLDSQPLKVTAPPKTLPLLAYLLLHRTQSIERQQAAYALWPDEPEGSVRANLRRHLHYLSQALPPPLDNCPWVLSSGSTLQWNACADFWLDVAEFERLSASPATLAEAAALYQGDLLATLYDDWVFFERERLREVYFATVQQLILQNRSRRDYPRAIGYAQQLLVRDPLREDVLRQLLALRYESGDRAGAIQEYERFAVRLKQELAVAPMPETQTLYESIVRNERLPAGEEHPLAASDCVEVVLPGQPLPGAALPFAGRELEMQQLAILWSRAASGHGGLALVSGEGGVGKTRLAREMALLAESQGGRLLIGGASSGEPRAYQAVTEAFESVLPLIAALEINPLHLAALAALLPKLTARRKLPTLSPLTPERERTRLFDAAAACLEGLARPRPLLLILEDLQWAGETTLALVEFLVRRAANHPILILGTYRDEEIPCTHPLRLLRRRLQSEDLMKHLALNRLSPQAVECLLAQLPADHPLFAPASAQFSTRLYVESEGNPLFIELFLQHWHESGEARPEALPGGVRPFISQRLARLPSTARAYAEVAAVVGPAFDAEVVRETGGWDEAQALDCLGTLLDQRLVRDAGSRSHFDYVFAHHLIQSVIYTEIPAAKRKRRHHRVAEVLGDLYPDRVDEMAGELASHYDQGSTPDQAILHYLVAAHHSLEVFADAEALVALDRAIQLADESPSSAAPRTVVDLLLMRESIYHRRGERRNQYADLQRLEQWAESDAELTCEVLNRRILYHKAKGERDIQKELVGALGAQAQAIGSRHWQAEALFAEGNYLKLIDDNPAAIARLQEAITLYSELQDRQAQVACCCLLSEIFVVGRQSAEAEQWAQKALALCDSEIPTYQLMYTLWNLSANGLISKEFERCLTYGQKLLATAERASDRDWQAAAHRLMGMANSHQLRIDEARQHLNTALDLYRLIQKTKGCALTLESLGNLEISLGHYFTARQHYQQAFEILEQLNDLHGIASQSINLAFAAALQEDYAAERIFALQGVSFARKIHNRFLEGAALQNLGEAARELGDFDTARQILDEAITLLDDPSLTEERTSVLADLALTYWKVNDLVKALQSVEEILSLYPQVEGTDDNVHRFLWTAARILRAAGQAEQASQTLTRAYRSFQKALEAIPDAESRQAFAQIRHNRQIVAAHEHDEWP
jgi:DNA-binding SARP family transcriptional activator/predicted ATPase